MPEHPSNTQRGDLHGDLHCDLHRARRLRFLCSGNVVRSAFAELLARHLGCPLPVDSAATRYRNAALFPETRAALLARGIDPEPFRPRHQDTLPDTPAERTGLLLLGMTRGHLEDARAHAAPPALGGHLLGLLDPEGGPPEIPDPVLDGADFDRTYERIERCVRSLLALLGGPHPLTGRGPAPPG